MSREDALFRAIRPTAEALAERHMRNGGGDVDRLTEQVLDAFRPALDIRDYEAGLRRRIAALLADLVSRAGG